MKKFVELGRVNNIVVKNAFERTALNFCLHKRNNGYSVFLLAGCVPGMQTWHLSSGIAAGLAALGFRTLLTGTDFGLEGRCESGPGLMEYATGGADVDDIVIGTDLELLDYIGGGSGGAAGLSPVLHSDRLAALFGSFRDKYDFVMIDAPGFISQTSVAAIAPAADAAVPVCPVDGGKESKKALIAGKKHIERLGMRTAGVLCCGVNPSEYERYARNNGFYEKRLFAGKI